MSDLPADILVIDDERQIRRLLNLTLTGAGYHVRECENGQLGLSETALKRPDAIILDLGLPDINGLEVLKQLREWTQVPILILTAWDREDEKVDALDAGADDYLTKPFSGRELLARLRVMLRRNPAGQGALRIPAGIHHCGPELPARGEGEGGNPSDLQGIRHSAPSAAPSGQGDDPPPASP